MESKSESEGEKKPTQTIEEAAKKVAYLYSDGNA